MKTPELTEASIAAGRRAFHLGVHDALARTKKAERKPREQGPGVVVGAIAEALDMGFCWDREIVPMVARISGCRTSTVEMAFYAFGHRLSRYGSRWERDIDGSYGLPPAEVFGSEYF